MNASDIVDYFWDITEQEFPLVLTYLSDYIDRNEDASPSLHDMLIQEYIQELFIRKPKKKEVDERVEDEETLRQMLEKFRQFLN